MSGIYERIPAAPEEVEAFASSLSEAYLHCRVWGHDPEPHTVVLAKGVEGFPHAYWEALLRCSHGCGVLWQVLVGRDGEVLRRKLDYSGAPGYLSPHGWINSKGRAVIRTRYFVGATGGKKPRKRKAR